MHALFFKYLPAYFKVLRPKNLILIGATQWFLYAMLIVPFVEKPLLSNHLLLLFIIDTMLIAAAGNLINDILDVKADEINKPLLSFIPNPIAKKSALVYYFILLILGFSIAAYIAFEIQKWPLLMIYPVVSFILFLYSYSLKNTILLGNIIVSLFVAFVTGIIFFAERTAIMQMKVIHTQRMVIEMFIAFIVFSFMINMIREMIKDIEDAEGDQVMGFVTLPIKYGKQKSVQICQYLTLLTIILLIVWMLFSKNVVGLRNYTFLLLFVGSPLVVSFQILTASTHKRNFSQLSAILKAVMVAGLFSLYMLTSNY